MSGHCHDIGDLLTTQDSIDRGLLLIPIFAPIAQVGFGIIVIVRGLLNTPITVEEDIGENSTPTLPIDEPDEEPPPTPPADKS
jgi:hypothetical protein